MRYRPEIDGLRAVAVLPVLIFHAASDLLPGGYIGVDVFFVISGYLITSIIADEMDRGTFTFAGFYERRARRLIPALFVVMAASLLLAWFWLLPNEMRRFSQSLVAVSLFVSNIFFLITSGYFGSAAELKPLLHTWSLAVEEQYYLVFPVLLLWIRKSAEDRALIVIAALALVSFALAEWLSRLAPAVDFLVLPTRFWELLVGAMVSLALRRKVDPLYQWPAGVSQWASASGVLMLTASMALLDQSTPFPGVYALAPVLGSALIIGFATPATVVGRWLAWKPLVALGLVSYSAYLWHQPLLAFARQRLIAPPGRVLSLSLCVLACGLAFLTWRFVETPFRRSRSVGRRVVFGTTVLGAAAFCAFGLAGHFSEGFRFRVPAAVAEVSIARENELRVSATGCAEVGGEFALVGCTLGDRRAPLRVALVGDSHAQALVSELDSVLGQRRLSFVPLVKSRCRLNLHMAQFSRSFEESACIRYQAAIGHALQSDSIDTVIVVSRWDYPIRTAAGLEANRDVDAHLRSIKDLMAMGKTVVLVYPIPVHTAAVSEYMAKNLQFYDGKLPPLVTDTREFVARTRYIVQRLDALGESSQLIRVRPHELLCDESAAGVCRSQERGRPLYFDESHLSALGAMRVAEQLASALAAGVAAAP